MTNECVTRSPPRGRFNRRRLSGRRARVPPRLRPEGRGARACRQSGACASLPRRRATLNFYFYESGGARPVAESLCALCAEACASDGKAGDLTRGDATSGVAWRISPPLKFRWSRQTRHCSSPLANGDLRLSSGRFTDAREGSRPATAWKCVALTTKACAIRTSSTSPRAARACRFTELLRPDSNVSSAFPLVKIGGTNYSTDAGLDEAAPSLYARL